MRAFQIAAAGDTARLRDVAAPRPGPGEVAVDVAAAALNFGDLLLAAGTYQVRPETPFTLGMELAGTVAELGEGVSGPAPGTRVMAYRGVGALAGRAVVPAADCLALPDAIPFATGAAIPVAYGTSELALFHRGRLAAGETLVVTGAAGGVGLTAVELAARAGARVVACARGTAKLRVAEGAGAAETIDTSDPDLDLRAAIRDLGGADVLYDTVGGAGFEGALRALRPGGRAIVVGFAGGEVGRVRLNHLLVKNVDVIGFYWGGYAAFAPEVLRAGLARCVDLVAAGSLRPHVGAIFPLARVEEGFELLRSRGSTGKVVIEIGEEDRQSARASGEQP